MFAGAGEIPANASLLGDVRAGDFFQHTYDKEVQNEKERSPNRSKNNDLVIKYCKSS